MPAASWSRLWRSLRPADAEYRLIRARRWPPWVGTSRPASWACRGATAAGNAMAKQGARVARRRDCAAFGYVVNRATSDRVQPLRFFILVGSRGRWATARSCPRAAPGMFCSGRGGQGRNPEGAVPRLALGAAALSMPGTGHRARWCRAVGTRIACGCSGVQRVKGAAPCQSRGTLAAFHTETPLWGVGVKYSRS